MGTKNHKKKKIEIKCENNIPTTCELIGNRKIIEKKKMYGNINYLLTSKFDNQEIIIIAYGYGVFAKGDIDIFDNQTLQPLTNEKISDKFLNGIVHKIIEIKTGKFLISTYTNIEKIKIEKDNCTNKFKVTKVKNFLLKNQIDNTITQIIKLENGNFVILNNNDFLRLFTSTKLNNKKKKIYKETIINLSDPKLENYDMVPINNDIIVYNNEKYLNIFSLVNKQIRTKFQLIISYDTDDIIRKISDDMIFFAGINNLYFISIKKGIIVKHIVIPNIYRIVGLGDLSDNNILCASMVFRKRFYSFDFCQFKYNFEKTDVKKEEEFKVNINSVYQFEDSGYGNIYIKELEDKRIIFGTEETIYIFGINKNIK